MKESSQGTAQPSRLGVSQVTTPLQLMHACPSVKQQRAADDDAAAAGVAAPVVPLSRA